MPSWQCYTLYMYDYRRPKHNPIETFLYNRQRHVDAAKIQMHEIRATILVAWN